MLTLSYHQQAVQSLLCCIDDHVWHLHEFVKKRDVSNNIIDYAYALPYTYTAQLLQSSLELVRRRLQSDDEVLLAEMQAIPLVGE